MILNCDDYGNGFLAMTPKYEQSKKKKKANCSLSKLKVSCIKRHDQEHKKTTRQLGKNISKLYMIRA